MKKFLFFEVLKHKELTNKKDRNSLLNILVYENVFRIEI